MARGQATFLVLTNRVLRRLGKTQTTATLSTLAADSWGGIVRDLVNEAQQEVYKEHDWSTLLTSGTISSISVRTYDLATSFSTFGREIDLISTTNSRRLQPVNHLDIDEVDPGLDDAGAPTAYTIAYPDLLFNRTPSSETFRLRYVRRPTDLSGNTDVSLLPEFCDTVLVLWVYWQLQATREDAQDGGEQARGMYQESLARAIGQDRRRMDRLYVMQPVYPVGREIVPFPAAYDRAY